MSVAIKVQNIGKKYTIASSPQPESLVELWGTGVKNLFKSKQNSNSEFWALKDVTFEVNAGDRVGIIGRNGAGKSTLLKVLSRIVKPTTGRVEYFGKMVSLLEVGTGFHGDLTGRENIFLNGSLLGMSKSDIKNRFDEIVAFSEIEKFIDVPVKRYSSGMYVRLAFAVAAHLEPDILIVDEVLAVGDAAFQEKCLGKMNEVSTREGRTILFVSHQMAVLSALCNRSVLLEKGQVKEIGDTDSVINSYLHSGENDIGQTRDDSSPADDAKLKIRAVRVLNNNCEPASEVNNAYRAFIEISVEIFVPGRGYDVSLEIKHIKYGSIFTTCLKDADTRGNDYAVLEKGINKFRVPLPLEFLRGGEYLISASAAVPKIEVLDIYKFDTVFHVLDSASPVAKTTEGRNGAVMPVLTWNRI